MVNNYSYKNMKTRFYKKHGKSLLEFLHYLVTDYRYRVSRNLTFDCLFVHCLFIRGFSEKVSAAEFVGDFVY